jgi:2-aminoethylphosphonate-pyruvate transaminase
MKLLIPGPVSTQPAVRAAAAQDFAPWDNDFRPIYAGIRARVLTIAGTEDGVHATLPLQGCGHFTVEAAIRTFVPRASRLLIPSTGAYADRAIRLARESGYDVATLSVGETDRANPAALEAALRADPSISHVLLVYSETGSGIIHDVPALAEAAGRAGRRVIVDAVSAFGALPLALRALPMIDAVIFTANKCLEGLPGIAFAVARVDRLIECQGRAGSWSLDLADIYQTALRAGWGSFRFTPPAQAIVAFSTALDLYEAEGGPARLARYTENMRVLYHGVRQLGLQPYLPESAQGPIVMNVHAPDHPAWSLQKFVDAVKQRGFLISNFYNTKQPSFRVGCIGAITPQDMQEAVAAVGDSLVAMGVTLARAA